MADAQINGARIWYEVHGEGEDHLLQIGGAGFAHENFGFVTDKMTPHFKVIEFDLRGYGLSERPEQEYSMELWADDVKGLLDEIGVERAHIHGTSMGGMVALAFAGRYPERVDGLVLDCASAKSDFMARAHWEVWKQLAQAYGMGSEPLALEIATKCLSRAFLDTPAGPETVKVIQGVLERNCVVPVFAGACDAMANMDLRPVRGQGHRADAGHGGHRGLPDADRRRPGRRRRALDRREHRGRDAVRDRGQRPHEPDGGARALGAARDRVLPVGGRQAGHRRLMRVTLCDVGPRDGLQNDQVTLEPAVRAELCDRLAATGLPRVECGSFVNPKLVPQMAGAEEVFAASSAPTASSTPRSRSTGAAWTARSPPAPTRCTSPTRSPTRSARATRTRRSRRPPTAHEAMIAAAHAAGVRASVTLGRRSAARSRGPCRRRA